MALRFKKLDLNLLVALDALLTERSVTGAAQRLNLSQSATSGILGRLRDYFDDELLVQVGRKMTPSPLGLELLDNVRDVLQTVNSTIVTRTDFDHAVSDRHFRFCASDFVKTVLLTRVARELAHIAPNITIEISSLDCDSAGMLDRGEVDFLITPEYLLDSSHPMLTLFESRHVCVLWDKNDKVGPNLTFNQFLELGHVVVRFGKSRTPGFDQWFIERFGHARHIEVVTDDFNSMAQLVEGTNRVAIIHEHLAAFYAEHLDLRIVQPPIEIPPMVESMQWHRSLDRDQGHLWMRGLIERVASSLPVSDLDFQGPAIAAI